MLCGQNPRGSSFLSLVDLTSLLIIGTIISFSIFLQVFLSYSNFWELPSPLYSSTYSKSKQACIISKDKDQDLKLCRTFHVFIPLSLWCNLYFLDFGFPRTQKLGSRNISDSLSSPCLCKWRRNCHVAKGQDFLMVPLPLRWKMIWQIISFRGWLTMVFRAVKSLV